jgi:hypothetical protein
MDQIVAHSKEASSEIQRTHIIPPRDLRRSNSRLIP